ncbi:MAG TPA: type II toxin-antitoxin system Phd/YefM family antitoxin [Candidatus Latescibacteria bacterium]|nr:type II toxin-antitoxin system Phd/YefM family antitoxin [Candidatus Latescibacterota bacterium]
MRTIPLTKAKARFSGLVDRLIHLKEHIVITTRGIPVAALIPYEEWERLESDASGGLASVAPPHEEFDAEIDAMVKEIYAARTRSRAREPVL